MKNDSSTSGVTAYSLSNTPTTHCLVGSIWEQLGGCREFLEQVQFSEPDSNSTLPSVFCVSELAAAALGAAGTAIAELLSVSNSTPSVVVDQRLASLWFGFSIRPDGWSMPAPWDAIVGDYASKDGWIRLHTNAPHHRRAALSVLGVVDSKTEVAALVEQWSGEALEAAIVAAGGCAAVMRSQQEWETHAQGISLANEPLIDSRTMQSNEPLRWSPTQNRPLQGLKVLDLTRVLAGPVATRFLAGFGAEVLRIDPPDWDEPGVVPDVTLGKRCARLDLRDESARVTFKQLLSHAHILIHGYRPGALDQLGFNAQTRQEICPGLIDVSLNAYGWIGPWRNRRGFDSLVQMSCGIANAGMIRLQKERPTPLPVQALDHAAGYLMAAGAIRGITQRLTNGRGIEARTSLARVAKLLTEGPSGNTAGSIVNNDNDWAAHLEQTSFGPAFRLKPPLQISSAAMYWDRPASALGSSAASWSEERGR